MITVVSGLPRSGTSMMMQMLQAGGLEVLTDQLRTPDDSNPRGYFEFEPVKSLARNSDWVADAEGKVVKVIAQLISHLPAGYQYAVLFMQRDLDEILRSQTAMLERLGPSSAAANPAILKPVFERQLASARTFVDGRDDMRALTVDHRACLVDPESVIEAVVGFLRLDLDLPAAAAVVDPSLHRERL